LKKGEVIREALRHSLRSPLKKYKPGHFTALANRNGRRAFITRP
jgi:hypothetical protein